MQAVSHPHAALAGDRIFQFGEADIDDGFLGGKPT